MSAATHTTKEPYFNPSIYVELAKKQQISFFAELFTRVDVITTEKHDVCAPIGVFYWISNGSLN